MSIRDGASNTGQGELAPNPTIQKEDAKKLKLKQPDVFRGERRKLRGWLAQMRIYFMLMGWANDHDQGKIS